MKLQTHSLLCILALFLLSPGGAFATELSPEQVKFYQERTRHGYIKLENLTDWLSASEKSCKASVVELIGHLTELQLHAVNSTKKNSQSDLDSERAFAKISKLFLSYYNESLPCHRALMRTYLMASVGFMHSRTARAPVAIVHFLFEGGFIGFLSEDQRKNWGEKWRKRNKKGRYNIYGGYDCKLGKIWLDPFDQRIYNLGSTISHELQHLFSDKQKGLVEDFPAEERVLLGEIVASSMGGFLQRRMTQSDLSFAQMDLLSPKGNPTVDSLKGFGELPANGFKLSQDFSLFNRKGDLQAILPLVASAGQSAGEFIKRSGLLGCNGEMWPGMGSYQKHLEAVVERVAKVYFDKYDARGFLARVQPYTCRSTDPYSEFLHRFEYKTYEFDSSFLLETLKSLRVAMSEESSSCKAVRFTYSAALENYRKLTSDSGRASGKGSNPAIPTNPGTEGVKTSIPTHPCLHEVEKI